MTTLTQIRTVGSGGAGGIGGLMLQAWQWIVDRCNAPDVGYNQDYRNEQTVNGITYYDCSSLIFYGLGHAGFKVNLTAWPFTTESMPTILKNLGFEEIILPADYTDFKFKRVIFCGYMTLHSEVINTQK